LDPTSNGQFLSRHQRSAPQIEYSSCEFRFRQLFCLCHQNRFGKRTQPGRKIIESFEQISEGKPDPSRLKGAQATIQRWYADPVWNCAKPVQPATAPLPCKVNEDRTLRTVFTHDHFGPSTHQQVGLYAGLVIEPTNSKWFDSSSGTELGKRFDGGPTTFQANINLADPAKRYREFLLEFQDRQLAYANTSISTPKPYQKYGPTIPGRPDPNGPWGWVDAQNAVNPPESSQPDLIPGNPPTPDLITSQMSEGAYSLSYFNEPLPYRIAFGTAEQTNIANAFRSIPRGDNALNCQPVGQSLINPLGGLACPGVPVSPNTPGFKFPPAQPGADPNDPYTPCCVPMKGTTFRSAI
jgi:manganese oxidase